MATSRCTGRENCFHFKCLKIGPAFRWAPAAAAYNSGRKKAESASLFVRSGGAGRKRNFQAQALGPLCGAARRQSYGPGRSPLKRSDELRDIAPGSRESRADRLGQAYRDKASWLSFRGDCLRVPRPGRESHPSARYECQGTDLRSSSLRVSFLHRESDIRCEELHSLETK